MPDQIPPLPNEDDLTPPAGDTPPAVTPPIETSPAKTEAEILEEAIDAKLAPMKENMNTMAAERDAAIAKIADLEKKTHDAEVQALKDAGKLQEAQEKENDALALENKTLKASNVSLTRDLDVREALGDFTFASAKAAKDAERSIVGDLVQNEAGTWLHRGTGKSIQDYAADFAADPENDYLFKAKRNSGGGDLPPGETPPATGKGLDQPIGKVLSDFDSGKIQRKGKQLHPD